MKITYRHGYSGDVEYNLVDVVFCADKPYPYFRLVIKEYEETPWPLYATSFYHEKGKYVFDCPENF